MSADGLARPPRPWYREPLVWLLIALPLSAVLGGIATITLAIRSDDGLVVDDYYRRGLAINAELEREHRATELGLRCDVDASGRSIRVRLSAPSGFRYPPQLALRLSHATRAGFDRAMQLHAAGDGGYRAALDTPLQPGRWYAEIAADDWRLVTTLRSRDRARD